MRARQRAAASLPRSLSSGELIGTECAIFSAEAACQGRLFLKKGANGLMSDTPLNLNSAEGEVPRGTTVFDVNGDKVGQVTLSALRDGYFVVEQGWLFTHELFLPPTAIAKRDDLWIGLNLSKEELRQQRWRVPPDEWLVSGSMRPIVSTNSSESEGSSTRNEDMSAPPQESDHPLSTP
jgi:hypothetical protein